MQAIAIIGTKKAGKTTTIENLIIELTTRGYKTAAIKHIPESNFTIDTPEKDTWRYAQAGAQTIISLAPNETATIEKTTDATPLENLLKKCADKDVVFIEGFKKTVAQNPIIPKIAVVKNRTEAKTALESYKPIIAFTGPYNTTKLNYIVPYANAKTNPQKLADFIEKFVLKK